VKITRSKIRQMIKESLHEQLVLKEGGNWGNVSAIEDFKMKTCDLSGLDLGFINFLKLFESDKFSDKDNYEKNSMITNIANAMGEEPEFINATFKQLFSLGGGAMETLQLVGGLGVGSTAFCELATELSQKYSGVINKAGRSLKGSSSLGYQNNKSSPNEPTAAEKQYFFNGIIDYSAIKNAVESSSRNKIFESVDSLKRKLSQTKLNGFDAIILQMFMPNTITKIATNASPRYDVDEVTQLDNFITQFSRQARRSPVDNRQTIEIFKQLFLSLVVKPEDAYSSVAVKRKRMSLFVNYLTNEEDELNKLFINKNELAKSIDNQLKRIQKFTT